MNFQAIEQANGKQLEMYGTFTEVGGAQFTQSAKAKAVCKVRDMTGIEHKVHIYKGNGQLPTPQNLNQRCQFNLSSFQGNYQGSPYIGYSGFWNSTGQTAPPNAPQAPQNALQSTNSGNGRNTSIERQCAWKGACNRARGTDMSPNDIVELARQGIYFIETGNNANALPEYDDEQGPPPDDSDIPF